MPAAGAGNETVIVPVGTAQVGWAVTLAVGATGFAGTALTVKEVIGVLQPFTVAIIE